MNVEQVLVFLILVGVIAEKLIKSARIRPKISFSVTLLTALYLIVVIVDWLEKPSFLFNFFQKLI